MGADGVAVGDGSGLQVVEAGTRFKVQLRMLRVDDQQTTSFAEVKGCSIGVDFMEKGLNASLYTPIGQCFESAALNGGKVHKHILATV